MTLLIDGKPEELAQFLGLFVDDDDDTNDTDNTDNDTDDDVNKRLAAEFTEIVKRYPHLKKFWMKKVQLCFGKKANSLL